MKVENFELEEEMEGQNSGEAVVTSTVEEIETTGGKPIQIVKIDDEGDHSFYLDEDALSEIMNDERIRDKPLCIVSVAGKIIIFRTQTVIIIGFIYRCISKREIIHARFFAPLFESRRFRRLVR